MVHTALSRVVLAGALAAGMLSVAQAQTYPSQPITMVISSNAGGSADFSSRLYAEVVSRSIGQRVQVENKPGASGIVAAEYLKTRAPDGYVIAQIGSGLPEAMPAMQTIPFDTIKDFTYITPLTTSENYLWVRSDYPPKTLKEFIEYSKVKPGGISIGNSGAGSPSNIATALLKIVSGADIVLVNYRGNVEAMNDFLAGRLDGLSNSYITARPAIEAGKARVLAINAEGRSRRFPEAPTYAEAGFPGVAVPTWWGLIGPKGMPQAVVDKLNAEFTKASKDPELVRRFNEQDLEPLTMPQDKFVAMVTANQERQGKAIKQMGLKME